MSVLNRSVVLICIGVFSHRLHLPLLAPHAVHAILAACAVGLPVAVLVANGYVRVAWVCAAVAAAATTAAALAPR